MALYREWRPQIFREVIGQEHVCRTLQNAVVMGRTAHAYLFCGPRGTGKTSTARILAKALNCLQLKDGEPCNDCPSCLGVTKGVSLNVIEMDAASHRGIEEIRDLKQKVSMAPSGGRYKVYIIDEVHMLTGEAFNALLKTLEEPPAHAVFILATTEAHKVPLTILSRCQRFDFRRLSRPLIKGHLDRVAKDKKWLVDEDALELISRQASGALRDALGLLDQAASFTGGKIGRADIEMLTGALGKEELEGIVADTAKGNVPAVLKRLDAIFSRGCDPHQVLLQLADHVRDQFFKPGIGRSEQVFLARFLRGIALAEGEMRGSARPDLLLELVLLRMTGATAVRNSPYSGGQNSRHDPGADPAVREQAAAIAAKRDDQPQMPDRVRRGAVRQDSAVQGTTSKPSKAGSSGGKADKARKAAEETSSIESKDDTLGGHQPVQSKVPEGAAGRAHGAARPSQEFDLKEIKKFLSAQTRDYPLLSRVVPKCRLEREGNRLLLAAPPFFCDLIRQEENMRILQKGLRDYGCPLTLELVQENGESAPVDRPSTEEKEQKQEPQAVHGEELLNMAIKKFNGKIIKRIEEGE